MLFKTSTFNANYQITLFMKNFTMLLYTFFCTVVLWGQERPQWMRYVSISPTGEYIAFTYKGDLYKVPSQGGQPFSSHFIKP